MVTRREIGFLAVGAGGIGSVAYISENGVPYTSVPSADPMTTSFPVSNEFDKVEWRDDAWIDIHTATTAEGESLALAFGDVADPLSGDSVTSNMTERGAVIEFGLADALVDRDPEQVSIASYRRSSQTSAKRLDTVTAPIPEKFR